MDSAQLEIVSRNRFITRRLVVVPEILEYPHEFQLAASNVEFKLPNMGDLSDVIAEGKIKLVSWKESDGQKIPLALAVGSVDVMISKGLKVNVPRKILEVNLNAYDLVSEKQREELNNLAGVHSEISREAFDVWVRVLRWKSNNWAICRPEIHGAESGWSTYLLDSSTKKDFWRGESILTLPNAEPVTPEEWGEAAKALKQGHAPPVYIDLMFDGIEHLDLGDYQRATVDFAVACEAFMRSKVLQPLPENLGKAVLRYIDDANIRQVLERLFPETLNKDKKKALGKIKSTLHKLFDARNTILHSGHKEGLTVVECRKYLDVTNSLIRLGSDY